jgi:hypothetical protein
LSLLARGAWLAFSFLACPQNLGDCSRCQKVHLPIWKLLLQKLK